MEHFYLQVHPSVEGDPRIATLPATAYRFFMRLRLMALKGELPSWSVCCQCQNIHSPERQERLAQILEERRLLGFRKEDDQPIIAAWTMPQLGRDAQPLPARRKPSESPEAQAERQRRSRLRRQTPVSVEEALSEAEETPHLAQFFGAVTPPEEPPVTPLVTPDVTPQSIDRERIEKNSNSDRVTGGVTGDASEAERTAVADSLRERGIEMPCAVIAALLQKHSVEEIERQALWLPHRGKANNPAGMLRRAIEQNWEAPQAWLDEDRQRAQAEARRSAAQARSKAQASRRQTEEEEERAFKAQWDALSEAELKPLVALVWARLEEADPFWAKRLREQPDSVPGQQRYRTHWLNVMRDRIRGDGGGEP